jgi:hypothetical protein
MALTPFRLILTKATSQVAAEPSGVKHDKVRPLQPNREGTGTSLATAAPSDHALIPHSEILFADGVPAMGVGGGWTPLMDIPNPHLNEGDQLRWVPEVRGDHALSVSDAFDEAF